MNTGGSTVPPEMFGKLHEISQRDRRVRSFTALFRAAAILAAAVFAAMILDWIVVFFDPAARWILTLTTLALALCGIGLWALMPMLRSRSLTSIARDLDRSHPALEERYSTLTEVSLSPDAAVLRGSETMLRKVAEQASEMSAAISPETVVRRHSMVRAGQILAAVCGALLLFFAIDFQLATVLFGRFWMPGGDFALTHLKANPGDIVIGKGESITLEFVGSGKKTDSAELFIRNAGGTEILPVRAAVSGNFVHTRSAVNEPFEYRARSGDGQTPWHRIDVADRPKLSLVTLKIVPPAYSRLPVIEEKTLPRRVRALEGSTLSAVFKVDQDVRTVELKFSDGKLQALTAMDGAYRFGVVLTNTLAFTPTFINEFKLENHPKQTCQIVVYEDQPPSVKIIVPEENITARSDDKVSIEFEARDDFGISEANLIVTRRDGANVSTRTIPVPLGAEEGRRQIRKQVDLNLSDFDAKQDVELSYVIQVTDTKELQATGAAEFGASETELAAKSDAGTAENPQPQSAAGDSSQRDEARQATSNAPRQNETAAQRADNEKHISMAQKETGQAQEQTEGAQPPPNDMSKRVLDVGQSSTCSPMRIVVDEWGRSFEGQQREKLEIAIDPVLKRLDEQLAGAQKSTDETLAAGKASAVLAEKDQPAMSAAKGNLRDADGAVTELRGKTAGTPYAFIGLQLHDIRETHISPARNELAALAFETAEIKSDLRKLETASFEIRRAREKLADLTKTYAAAKTDYKLADAMQRLQKMHQVFLEDSHAMLGSQAAVLNPQERKVAEVDDEFVESLRKMLEAKKRIMAELAEILANDPRLLRRFMAMQQMQATSLRDQMTLLARRQDALKSESTEWLAAAESDRARIALEFLKAQSAEQAEIAGLAAKLHENIITWLPTGVPEELQAVADCRKMAADAGRFAAEAAEKAPVNGDQALESARRTLERIRALRSRLPVVESAWVKSPQLSGFVANRLNESAELITRQSGWIKKIEALRTGDFPAAAEVDQHRLTVDTTTLSGKLDTAALQVGHLSAEIDLKAKELTGTMREEVLPVQTGATTALSKKTLKEAAANQATAVTAFASAEKQFDELLKLIIAKLDEAPPPSGQAGDPKSLEEMLAMLEEEQKLMEGLGIPCRPLNVSILKDWMQPGSQQGAGSALAQARAAMEQAQRAATRADRMREQARRRAEEGAVNASSTAVAGPNKPRDSWNTLVSKLGDELQQGRDNVPPEQYRQAIEHYFNTISENIPAAEQR